MKKTVFFSLLSASFALLLLFGCGKKAPKRLTMVTEAYFPPYEFYSNGKLIGIDPEIVSIAARDQGCELEIADCSFDYLLQAVAEGKYDIGASAVSITEERRKLVDFTIPYAESRLMVVLPLQSSIRKPEDMKGRIIGTQKGSTSCDFVRQNIQEPATFPHVDLAAQALLAGKLDAVVVDEQPARVLVNSHHALKLLPLPLHVEQYGFAVRKGRPLLLKQLNDSIARMKQEGVIARIMEKYEKIMKPAEDTGSGKKKILRVAVDPTFPPYADLEENVPAGLEIDIMHKIASELGCEVQFELVGTDSLLRVVAKENGIDMGIAALSLEKHGEEIVNFSIPHSAVSQRFVVLKNSQVQTVADLKEKKVGTLFNTLTEEYVRRNCAEPECFSSVRLMLRELKAGHLDAIVLENFSADLLLSQDPSLRSLKESMLREKYGIAVRKENPELLQQVNRVLQRMLSDGTIEELRYRHNRALLR